MIDISELMSDADFCQPFTIVRSTGAFVAGVWQDISTNVNSYGAMQPAGDREINMVPEGDRVTGMVALWSSQPLYTTGTNGGSDPTAHISDVVVWHGQNYRVLAVRPWYDNGYWKAVATRMAGA